MSAAIKQSIYTVGGTVQAGGGSYLPRRADEDLLTLCRQSAFAYILTARQMGKSSLMVRTAEQLAQEHIRAVMIDLTQIGTQVTPEQWYLGLLAIIEEQLALSTDAVAWWQANSHLGFTQRLTNFFREVLLKEVAEPIVIFVDEIDTTLSLDFTDDFYAAIRFVYNARATAPEFKRLSFVLIGVATPGDLIRDPQRTPFNIGQRVDLADFTFAEALPLADGFKLPPAEAEQVLRWVMKWTNGHPYLTQRLCIALSEQDHNHFTEPDIDRVVANTFFGAMSGQDNNLSFVNDMLTKRAPELELTLMTYLEICSGKRPVRDEAQSIVKSHLKLSGVIRCDGGELQVRNRIYAIVFSETAAEEALKIVREVLSKARKGSIRRSRMKGILTTSFVLSFVLFIELQRNSARIPPVLPNQSSFTAWVADTVRYSVYFSVSDALNLLTLILHWWMSISNPVIGLITLFALMMLTLNVYWMWRERGLEKLRAGLAIDCPICGQIAPPVLGSENQYGCNNGHQFAGADHNFGQ